MEQTTEAATTVSNGGGKWEWESELNKKYIPS